MKKLTNFGRMLRKPNSMSDYIVYEKQSTSQFFTKTKNVKRPEEKKIQLVWEKHYPKIKNSTGKMMLLKNSVILSEIILGILKWRWMALEQSKQSEFSKQNIVKTEW